MLGRRFITTCGVTLGVAALLLGSTTGGRAQVIPPSGVAIPPEGALLSDAVGFVGEAQIASDNPNGFVAPCLENDEPDTPASVDLVGCGGTFNFSSLACAGASDNGPENLPPGSPELPSTCNVTASGNFANLVCGTGEASGTAAVTGGGESQSIAFGIVFVATVGIVTGNANDTSGDGTADPADYVVGVVDLGPPTAANVPSVGDCTNGFTVAVAALELDL